LNPTVFFHKIYRIFSTFNVLLFYDLFYVSPEGVEIEDNGIRETNAEYRDAIDKKIKSIIGMFRGNTITINGTVEESIEQVKNAVAQYV